MNMTDKTIVCMAQGKVCLRELLEIASSLVDEPLVDPF